MIKIQDFQEKFKGILSNRLIKNSGTLLSSNLVASIIGLLSFTITARHLGVSSFGLLVLVDTYVHIIDKFTNSQSWQAIIKFGADFLEKKDFENFKGLIKFGLIIDIAFAFLGLVLSIALLPLIGNWLNWSDETMALAAVYSLIIVFNVNGVPIGILRLLNSFKYFAFQRIVSSLFKLVGVIIVVCLGPSFNKFLFVWMFTEILGSILLMIMAWHLLRKHKLDNIFTSSARTVLRKCKNLYWFVISTNLTGTVKTGFREIDVMILGKLLGPAAVGLYKTAKKFSAFLGELSNPLYQAIYPELAKFWANKDRRSFINLSKRTALIAGGIAFLIWLIFLCVGAPLINLLLGPEYQGSFVISVLYMLGYVISIVSLPLSPMILAMGQAKINLMAHLISTVLYFILLFMIIGQLKLVGAGIAFVVYYLVWSLIMLIAVKNHLKVA